MKHRFKEGFYWGTAISALQTEGTHQGDGKSDTTFDVWFKKDPERFFNGEGNKIAVDFYHMYKEDIRFMKEMNHNSFRFSIAWSRLIPNGDGEINQMAVDYYNDLINELISNGIEPFICLFHFDMPWCMQEKGGWESLEVVDKYVEYAEVAFRLFGDRVKKWFTHNEPIVPIEGSYLYGFHYPIINDFKRGIKATYYTILSNSKAIKRFKELRVEGVLSHDSTIGAILSMSPVYPRDESNMEDAKAADICKLFFTNSFLDPMVKGCFNKDLINILREYDLLDKFYNEKELELINDNTIEFLGFNYYFPRRVKAKKEKSKGEVKTPEYFFDNYVMPNRKFNKDRGWEVYPKGIYDLLMLLKEEYNNIPVYISENGIGRHNGDKEDMDENGFINDDTRIDFIKDHLEWIWKAQEEGSNVCGYHMWSLMDNWSMSNAFKNKYGFLHVDRENGLKRSMKKSGYWFAEVSKNNEF
ncbi:MAG: glycoside hydrolase family 1 protein [Clostridium sp.]|uniref:glycoside hydrolase family 1 protein n=1 Tax=Clostridium sp. TaxID=1506 RepID=UPI002913E10F|nr:glycoside hydrolase family 1 protein [Clostridium sp.]MDU5108918.1 glycoside hydrolase family 1 protein [Clostridium sp.]